MTVKRILAALFIIFTAVSSAFALSDAEYKKMMKNAAFARAESKLAEAWEDARDTLSNEDFNRLKIQQRAWLANGRDKAAQLWIRDAKLSRLEAYTNATIDRAVEIISIVRASSLTPDDAVGYFDCRKNGRTVYLTVSKTKYNGELLARFSFDDGVTDDWEATGDIIENVLDVSRGEDYVVSLTYKDLDTVVVSSSSEVRRDMGRKLDGTYKRHYGK